MTDTTTPRCDALSTNKFYSDDVRAWRARAYDLEHELTVAQQRVRKLECALDDLVRSVEPDTIDLTDAITTLKSSSHST
jgi:hypothetical protein